MSRFPGLLQPAELLGLEKQGWSFFLENAGEKGRPGVAGHENKVEKQGESSQLASYFRPPIQFDGRTALATCLTQGGAAARIRGNHVQDDGTQ